MPSNLSHNLRDESVEDWYDNVSNALNQFKAFRAAKTGGSDVVLLDSIIFLDEKVMLWEYVAVGVEISGANKGDGYAATLINGTTKIAGTSINLVSTSLGSSISDDVENGRAPFTWFTLFSVAPLGSSFIGLGWGGPSSGGDAILIGFLELILTTDY